MCPLIATHVRSRSPHGGNVVKEEVYKTTFLKEYFIQYSIYNKYSVQLPSKNPPSDLITYMQI